MGFCSLAHSRPVALLRSRVIAPVFASICIMKCAVSIGFPGSAATAFGVATGHVAATPAIASCASSRSASGSVAIPSSKSCRFSIQLNSTTLYFFVSNLPAKSDGIRLS